MHPNDHHPLALRLAHWLDARLDLTYCAPSPSPQFYGLELIDPERLSVPESDGARTVFLGDGDVDVVAASSRFDAVAAVSHRWMPVVPLSTRPGAFVGRRRVRTVRVLVGTASAGVARFDDDPNPVVLPTALPPVA
jgi:hypothetical protein